MKTTLILSLFISITLGLFAKTTTINNQNKPEKRVQSVISPEIDKWINSEISKAPKNGLVDYNSPKFFNDAPARLIGCIKGYDKRAGFTTGIIYASNALTSEDFPLVAKIEPDGRFEVEIPMNMPKKTYIMFGDNYSISFYIEPGQTLAMILDWDEFLTADHIRNIRYKFKQIEFRGPNSTINSELMAYPAKETNYEEFQNKRTSMTPLDFKEEQRKELENNLSQFTEYLKNNKVSLNTQTILRNEILVNNATLLFDYCMSRDYYAKQDSNNKILKMPIPESYYDFLQKMSLNDNSLLLTQQFSTFINRFEFCDLFSKAQKEVYKKTAIPQFIPQKSLLEYFNEEKIEVTKEEQKFLNLVGKKEKSRDDLDSLQKMTGTINQFNTKYKNEIQKYADKYIIPFNKVNTENNEIEIWKAKDSILTHTMGLEPNLIYEIVKIRSLKFNFKFIGKKDQAIEFWDYLQQGIKTPYLIETGNRLFKEAFPEGLSASKSLPNGVGTDIFRKIIEPYKGKILFVDFWATTCGPCVSGIKSMKPVREKYAGNSDFDFIFITDERLSPEKDYNNFVKEQELKNVFRLPKDDYNYLRQLFKFNGIPKYVVIDANGDVLNDNFEMHNFEYELPKILPKYKK
jgi:thiol-disulfide isomerase/thioredoxin